MESESRGWCQGVDIAIVHSAARNFTHLLPSYAALTSKGVQFSLLQTGWSWAARGGLAGANICHHSCSKKTKKQKEYQI